MNLLLKFKVKAATIPSFATKLGSLSNYRVPNLSFYSGLCPLILSLKCTVGVMLNSFFALGKPPKFH